MNPGHRKILAAAGAAVRRYGWFPLAVFLAHEFCSHVVDGYARWPAIDVPMHFLGGCAMAYFLAGALRIGEDRELLRMPDPVLRFVLVFALVGTIAVFWEFAEWISDHFFGTNCQMNDLDDTMLDQLMGLTGALAYLLTALGRRAKSFYVPRKSGSKFLRST